MNTLRSARAPYTLALLLTIVGLFSPVGAAHAGAPTTPRDLHIMTACRVYDSRLTGGPLASGVVRDVNLPAGCGIPDDAVSIIVNMTAVNPTSAGYLQVYQGGTAPPMANALTFEAGDILGQFFVVKLGTAPSPHLHVQPTMGAGQTTHFVIDVLAFNGSGAPSTIALDNTNVLENQPVGTLVGNLSTTDPDLGDTHTYSLVSGLGSADNAKFQISGSQLQTNAILDREDQDTYSIRVRSTDNFGVFGEEMFSIEAINVNEPPEIVAGGVLNYTESDPPTAIDANLTVTDDSTNLQSATVQITGGFQSSEDVLSFVDTPNITAGAFDTGTGTLTLTGTDTVVNWQTALRSVRYNNTSANPSTAARTVTWIATDDGSLSSAPVTSTINVASTNTQPTISTIDDQLINEDASTGALAFTVGDAETPAASLIVTGLSSNPSIIPNANIVFGGSGASRTVTVTPLANANGGPVTITITVDDGSAAPNATASEPFDVTVTSVNDEPTLDPIPDPADILEDAGLQTVNLTGIGAGAAGAESGQILTVTAVSDNPGLIPNPTVVYTSPNATGSLQYTPVANQSGTAIITVTVQDDGGIANGGDDTIQRTFTVDVLSVNGEPTLDPIPDPADINEDAGLQTVSLTGISAGDGGSESGQVLTVTALSSNPGLIPHPTVIYTSPNATGSLQYTPVANQFGTAIITVTVQDDGGTANGGDDTIQRTFTVDVLSVNDEPTLDPIPDPADINEDAGLQTVSLTGISAGGAGSESGQTLTVTALSSNPGLIPHPTVIYTSPNATGSLQYTPVANQFGTAVITVTVQDNGGTANGGDDTIQRTFTVDVLASNDEPTLDPIPDPADILEDAGLQTVNLTGISAGGAGSESGQVLTVTALSSNPGLIPHPTVIYTSPNATGSLQYTPVANQFGTATITVTVQDDGGTANGGDDTIQRTFTVDVLSVNDEPTLDPIPDPADILEDAGLQTVSLTGISAGGAGTEPGQTLTVTALSSNPGLIPHPTVIYTSPNATGSLQYTPVANQFGTAIITVTVQDSGGTANGGDDTIQRTFTVDVLAVNDPPIFADATLDYTTVGNTQLRGGDLTPGSSVAHIRDNLDLAEKSIPSDIDGPAPPFTYSLAVAPPNGQASVSPDGTFTYEPNAGFAGPTDTFTVAVSDGGTAPNTSNLTVTVTISQMVWYVHNVVAPANPDNPAGGDGRSTNAFDTITALNAAPTGNGHIIFIFEGTTGTTPLSGAIALKDGQKLWGQGIALNVPGFGTPLVNATNKPRIRATTASTDVVSVPATAGNRNNVEIRGLDLEATGATSNAIDVTASGGNIVGITISDDNIRGATAEGIDLNAGATAAFSATVQNNTITSAGTGIDTRASSTGTTTVTASSNMITSTAGNAFDARTIAGATAATALRVAVNNSNVAAAGNGIVIDGSVAGTTTITGFANNVVDGSTGGTGISVASAIFDTTPGNPINQVLGGTTMIGQAGGGVSSSGMVLTNVVGDLAFTDLDIYNDVTGTGLSVTSTGALNAGAGTGFRFGVTSGAASIDSNGPAVSVNNATFNLGTMALLRSTNSTTTGLSLVNAFGGAGLTTLSASTGQISDPGGASGTAVNISGGTGNITLGIPITSTSGNSIVVASRTGDTVSFTNSISDTGGGISLTSNGGATISFSGQLTLKTGANAGFSATGGGTVTATGSGSSIKTTSGTALTVSSTTIGAGGLNFDCISAGRGDAGVGGGPGCTQGDASGTPANGIFLSSTGNGVLTVNGDGSNTSLGGNSSGGIIQNTTGSTGSTGGIGVYVNNARATLRRLNIHDHSNYGIFGGGTAVFNLEYSTVNSTATATSTNGDSGAADDEEGSVAFEEWAGSGTITSSIIGDGFSNNLRVLNTNGADLNRLTVSSSRFDLNGQTAGNDQIHLESRNSGTTLNFTLTGSTVKGARADWLNASANSSSTMDTIITGNTFTNISPDNHPATVANGNRILVTANATHTFEVANNTLKGSLGNALAITGAAAGAVLTGDITNNDIGDAAVANSGSTGAGGISVQSGAGSDITVLLDGNDVRQYNNHGIIFTLGDQMGSAATINATVTNNTTNTPGTLLTDFNGFHVNSGTVSTDNLTSCLNIFNNNFTGGGKGAVAPNNSDVRLRQRQGTTIQLPGYTGPARDNGDLDVAEVITYLRPAGSGGLKNNTFGTGNANSVSTGGGYVNSPGGAACLTP